MRTAGLLLLLALPAAADVLVLKDGRKVPGMVSFKGTHYEVTADGTLQMSRLPLRSEQNTMREPSGDQSW